MIFIFYPVYNSTCPSLNQRMVGVGYPSALHSSLPEDPSDRDNSRTVSRKLTPTEKVTIYQTPYTNRYSLFIKMVKNTGVVTSLDARFCTNIWSGAPDFAQKTGEGR